MNQPLTGNKTAIRKLKEEEWEGGKLKKEKNRKIKPKNLRFLVLGFFISRNVGSFNQYKNEKEEEGHPSISPHALLNC